MPAEPESPPQKNFAGTPRFLGSSAFHKELLKLNVKTHDDLLDRLQLAKKASRKEQRFCPDAFNSLGADDRKSAFSELYIARISRELEGKVGKCKYSITDWKFIGHNDDANEPSLMVLHGVNGEHLDLSPRLLKEMERTTKEIELPVLGPDRIQATGRTVLRVTVGPGPKLCAQLEPTVLDEWLLSLPDNLPEFVKDALSGPPACAESAFAEGAVFPPGKVVLPVFRPSYRRCEHITHTDALDYNHCDALGDVLVQVLPEITEATL
jgi:hypothetical protein